MDPFDICIAYIAWDGGGKRRPVLLLAKDGGYAEAFRITSQYASKSDTVKAQYLEILDWEQAGLARQSYVDTIESIEVPTAFISLPPIGKLSENDKLRLLHLLAE